MVFRLRTMKNLLLLTTLAAISIAITACGGSNPDPDPAPSNTVLSVVTTNNIVEDWVRRVGGDRVEVLSLVPAGADPHHFQPGARDITRVADADVVFSIGLGLEDAWLKDMFNADSTTSGPHIALGDVIDPIRNEHHSHDDHEDGPLDPHFWFDPLRVKLVISEITMQLTALDPLGAQTYRDNSISYISELDELHAWAQTTLNTVPEERRVLITSHHTLGYFALRYNYEIVGTIIPNMSEGTEVTATDLTELIDTVIKQGVPAIFVETTTSDRMANRIAEEVGVLAVNSIYTDSLSKPGEGADTYTTMMRSNITTITEALR